MDKSCSKQWKMPCFFRTITHRQYAQKPRKRLKTVLFSTFGLLKRAKKAKKIAFNYSWNGYFAKSWICTEYCIVNMHKGMCWYCCCRCCCSADFICWNPLNRLRLQRSIADVLGLIAGIHADCWPLRKSANGCRLAVSVPNERKASCLLTEICLAVSVPQS